MRLFHDDEMFSAENIKKYRQRKAAQRMGRKTINPALKRQKVQARIDVKSYRWLTEVSKQHRNSTGKTLDLAIDLYYKEVISGGES